MIFPKLQSSRFQTQLLRLPKEQLKDNQDKPRPPESLGIIPVAWPLYFDGNKMAAEIGVNLQGMFSRADERKAEILKTQSDRRYTPEGAQARGVELVQMFISRAPVGAYSPMEALSLIERHAGRLLDDMDDLKTARVDAASATEWRALIRDSGKTSAERVFKLKELMRDGNADALPAVLAAGSGLSGLTAEDYELLSLYVRASSNLAEMGRIWVEGEALDSLRLAVVRTTHELAGRAALPLDQQMSLNRVVADLPTFEKLLGKLDKVNVSVNLFAAAGLGYEQSKPANSEA